MSLYNMVYGTNPATFTILPMLGKHPDEYPRFRDCFIGDETHDNVIIVLTRTGGGNRDEYDIENEELTEMDNYMCDYDADFDCTYAHFVFNVPDEFKEDYNLIINGKLNEISENYRNKLYEVYPKLSDKWDKVFKGED